MCAALLLPATSHPLPSSNQIMNLIAGKVALDRIQAFMGAAEMAQSPLLPAAAPAQLAVEVRGASFAWSPDAPPLLHDVELAGEHRVPVDCLLAFAWVWLGGLAGTCRLACGCRPRPSHPHLLLLTSHQSHPLAQCLAARCSSWWAPSAPASPRCWQRCWGRCRR